MKRLKKVLSLVLSVCMILAKDVIKKQEKEVRGRYVENFKNHQKTG